MADNVKTMEVEKEEVTAAEGTERTGECACFVPRADIYEVEDQIVIVADVPGVDENSVEITLEKNILTDEVKKNGYGGIDNARMAVALEQIATTYSFEKKPKVEDIFDASFLPPAATRSVK